MTKIRCGFWVLGEILNWVGGFLKKELKDSVFFIYWSGGFVRMGHSSKKKKKGGGGGSGRRSKGRTTLKDQASHVGGDDNELLNEEITAL